MMESNNRRLIITHMELENFKSYAGVQEIGPFHKRFSSVVGPNGSGKSNVIDAMLFVFGRRAKDLRQKNVSELIHKSSLHKNLEYARVSVYFQVIIDNEISSDDFEVVEGSKFVITRTAFTNNQSKYSIDGKTSSPAEVGLILRQYGVDLDNNRFLILQGEVEQIAMMKPKAATVHEEGLLEYLEDIIGTKRFLGSIEEASKELDILNEDRVEKVRRLKIAETERENLSKSKDDAEKLLGKEREIQSKQNLLYQIHASVEMQNVSELTERHKTLSEKLTHEKSKISDTRSRLKEAKDKYDHITKEHNVMNQELQQCNSNFDSFERKNVKVAEDLKHYKASITKLQSTLSKESKREAELEKASCALKTQVSNYEETLADLEAKKKAEESQVESIMSSLHDSTAELRATMEACQAKLSDAERGVALLQSKKSDAVMAAELLQSRAAKASAETTTLHQKLTAISAEKDECQQKLNEVQKKIQGDIDGNGKVSGLEQEGRNLQQHILGLTKEEQSLQRQLKETTQRLEENRATLMQKQEQSRGVENEVVQKLLQATEKDGPLRGAGVLGRLGDLATVGKEHDVAVSTACSGLLDYLVVETAEGGQKCLQFLKDFKVGRATFIVLSELTEWELKLEKIDRSPTRPPLPRLFDLVTPIAGLEEKLRPALYMAMKDTLVASDLDTAVKTAYIGDRVQWRVVTLGGDLIDTSGTMSGGGKEVKSGGMRLHGSSTSVTLACNATTSTKSSSQSEEKVTQQLESDVAAVQNQLNSVRATRAEREQNLEQLQKSLQQLAQEKTKLQMALKKLVEQEVDLMTRITKLQSEASLTFEEQQQLAIHRATAQEADEELQYLLENSEVKALRMEAASLQRQLKGIGGPALSKAQSKIDSFSHQIETISGSFAEKRSEEKSNHQQLLKTVEARKKAEIDLKAAQDKLNRLEGDRTEMADDAKRLSEAVDAAKKKVVDLEGTLKTTSSEYSKLNEEMMKIQDAENNLTEELGKLQKELTKCKAEVKTWQDRAATIRQEYSSEWKKLMDLNRATMVDALSKNKSTPTTDTSLEINIDQIVGDSNGDGDSGDLPILELKELDKHTTDILTRNISALEAERDKMESNVNRKALQNYIAKDIAFKCRQMELDQVTTLRDSCRAKLDDLRAQRLQEFMAGFSVISLKLKEMYQMITLGGDAELELLDSLDPFSEGIVFSVRPPKKSWKNISNLSGGEKTLSSLALVFALHHYKPTPLYVMDEIDAALDFKNVSIVANYIKERTKNAQFVIISLRNNMFELADRLVGIYKTNDATKSVTIDPRKFEASCAGGRATTGKTKQLDVEGAEDDHCVDGSVQNKRALADVTNTAGK